MVRRFVVLLAILLAGCDPISRTKISIFPQDKLSDTQETHAIIDAIVNIAVDFGLEEMERRETDISFSDSRLTPGHNPNIWLTINHATDPTTIEIAEMYIAHPTDKHKQISTVLIQNLNSSGYNAKIEYQTADARYWPFYFGAFGVGLFALLVWKLATKRSPDIRRESAT